MWEKWPVWAGTFSFSWREEEWSITSYHQSGSYSVGDQSPACLSVKWFGSGSVLSVTTERFPIMSLHCIFNDPTIIFLIIFDFSSPFFFLLHKPVAPFPFTWKEEPTRWSVLGNSPNPDGRDWEQTHLQSFDTSQTVKIWSDFVLYISTKWN